VSSAVGAIVALVALAVTIIRWWLSTRPRVLLYSTSDVTSLLSAHAPQIAEGDLNVTFKGQPLTDPYLVTLRVENRSRKTIANRDFNADKPLVIRLGTSFAAPVSERPKVLVDELDVDNSDISIGPCLIRPGEVALLKFVTEGPPHISDKNPFAEIQVRPETEEYRQRRQQLRRNYRFIITVLAIASYILIGVFYNTTIPHLPRPAGGIASLHDWVQYFISVLFWPLGLWHPTFTMGRWLP
jgi:hypothetical protein